MHKTTEAGQYARKTLDTVNNYENKTKWITMKSYSLVNMVNM
jgi:hypothetical protein